MKKVALYCCVLMLCLLSACGEKTSPAPTSAITKKDSLLIDSIPTDDSLFIKPEDELFPPLSFQKTLSEYKEDSRKPKGQSFLVDDVAIAESPCDFFNAKLVIQQQLGKSILHLPEEHAKEQLVYTNNCDNALLSTIHDCYHQHRPLVLTPDIIWVAICQGVSIHINQHFAQLEKKIFKAEKPKLLHIRNDSLIAEKASYWVDFIDSLSNLSIQYTQEDIYNFFVSEFSTSSKITKTVYQVTLLESQSKAFSYYATSGCGIPFVRIAGTVDDWVSIKNKLSFLSKIGLSDWGRNLIPVIDEFILAAKGKANVYFWRSIYKDFREYDKFFISGWILKFFPYLSVKKEVDYDRKTFKPIVKVSFMPNPFLEGNRYLRSTLSLKDIPSGLAMINVGWENLFKTPKETKQMKVAAGFFGCKQYQDKSLEPFISWAVFEQNAAYFDMGFKEEYTQRTPPQLPWAPFIAQYNKDLAVYDKEQFHNQESSNLFLRDFVLESLEKHPLFKNKSFKNDTLEIEVLLDGTIGLVETFHQRNDKALSAFLRNLLCKLPGPWSPATAKRYEIEYDIPLEERNRILRVNSLVWIKF